VAVKRAGGAGQPLGIRDYSSDSGAAAGGVQPEFSLLPEGPQSSIKAAGSESELAGGGPGTAGDREEPSPVVALRVPDSWEVDS
jgi:hypothetical protein